MDEMDRLDQAMQAAMLQNNQDIPQTSAQLPDVLYSADGLGFRYDLFGCTVHYEYDEGLLQCPVAAGVEAPGFPPSSPIGASSQPPASVCTNIPSAYRTPCVFVRTHAPVARKVVTYYARRTGAWPLLPGPDCTDLNLVLLSARTMPEVPILDVSGVLYVYATRVEYTYGLLRPVTNQDGFAVGAAPFTQATKVQNTLAPATFQDGIA